MSHQLTWEYDKSVEREQINLMFKYMFFTWKCWYINFVLRKKLKLLKNIKKTTFLVDELTLIYVLMKIATAKNWLCGYEHE